VDAPKCWYPEGRSRTLSQGTESRITSEDKGPLVTVIINVHNGETHLPKAIESVLAQSQQSFVLKIVNNASTDSTQEVIELAARQDSRVTFKKLQKKVGLFEARNIAVEDSFSEFIAFLDSDDIWRSDKLEIALRSMKETGADIFYSNFVIRNLQKQSSVQAYGCPLPSGNLLPFLTKNYPLAFSSLVFRRTALQKMSGPFNSKLFLIGDYDLVLRMAREATFVYSPETTVTIQVHPSSLGKVQFRLREQDIKTWQSSHDMNPFLDKSETVDVIHLLAFDTFLLSTNIRSLSIRLPNKHLSIIILLRLVLTNSFRKVRHKICIFSRRDSNFKSKLERPA